MIISAKQLSVETAALAAKYIHPVAQNYPDYILPRLEGNANPSVTLVYIHVPGDPEHRRMAKEFCDSYMANPPLYNHETVIVMQGEDSNKTANTVFGKAFQNFKVFTHDDSGFDIGAYIAVSNTIKTDIVVCFGGSAYFNRSGWMKRMVEAWIRHGPGMYGSIGTHEVSPHLSTTGFWCSPEMLRRYPTKVETKEQRYDFEHGPNSLWRMVLARGYPVKLVTWCGEYDWQDWRKPPNIFRRGDQSNCIAFWHHCRKFESAAPDKRAETSSNSDWLNDPVHVQLVLGEKITVSVIEKSMWHFFGAHGFRQEINLNLHKPMNTSLVFSVFKGLSLSHLEKSLYSLSRQTMKSGEYILFDNNSGLSRGQIKAEVSKHFSLDQWVFFFAEHNGNGRTLSWANNRAIRLASHDTFIFTRADYIYDFHFCERMLRAQGGNPMRYATAWMWGMAAADLEEFQWRQNPQALLAHSVGARPERASHVDGPTFCTSKQAMNAAGWYDETLVGWGFDQQDLQTQMTRNGVAMVVIEEFLYFHMDHPTPVGERSLEAAREVWLKSPRRTPEIIAEEKRLKRNKRWYNRLLGRKYNA